MNLSAGIQSYGETWNCTVRVYINQTTYSEWKTATAPITAGTYAGTDDVFNDFLYNYNTQNC